ncbi:hypothetical protein Dimus_021319 [Dionaea muscipula]
MANGDDVRRRKLNKAHRKKFQKDSSSSVSDRVAALIAAKKRRKSGKRRKCEGMCFSLPTPDDPFNDRRGKKNSSTTDTKKTKLSRENIKISTKRDDDSRKKRSISDQKNMDEAVPKRLKMETLGNGQHLLDGTDGIRPENTAKLGKGAQPFKMPAPPSKYFFLCLKSIRNSFLGDGELSTDQEKSIIYDEWGVQFWKCYSAGFDVMETSGTNPTVQQIAWIASAAADSIANKEKEGGSFSRPFLLYLVPSQKDAVKVRSVCKPLKSLGVHTVCLHPGASVDHQIHGLKSCEPEFLVATPERLWELVSFKAIDISGVSLLVMDGLAAFAESGSVDVVDSIRKSIPEHSQSIVFQGHQTDISVVATCNIRRGAFACLSLVDSIFKF